MYFRREGEKREGGVRRSQAGLAHTCERSSYSPKCTHTHTLYEYKNVYLILTMEENMNLINIRPVKSNREALLSLSLPLTAESESG